MNPRVTDSPAPTEALKIQERQIKEHLQTVLPAEVYEKWIEHFVFEKPMSYSVVDNCVKSRVDEENLKACSRRRVTL